MLAITTRCCPFINAHDAYNRRTGARGSTGPLYSPRDRLDSFKDPVTCRRFYMCLFNLCRLTFHVYSLLKTVGKYFILIEKNMETTISLVGKVYLLGTIMMSASAQSRLCNALHNQGGHVICSLTTDACFCTFC